MGNRLGVACKPTPDLGKVSGKGYVSTNENYVASNYAQYYHDYCSRSTSFKRHLDPAPHLEKQIRRKGRDSWSPTMSQALNTRGGSRA